MIAVLLLSLSLCACGEENPMSSASPAPPTQSPGGDNSEEPVSVDRLRITVGDVDFPATLGHTATAAAFAALLPMSVTMRELNGNEKYHYLPSGLPASAVAPGRIQTGDLMLFGSDCLVLFYDSHTTTYHYTPLGRIEDASMLAAALGRGNVTVKFEIRNNE